MISEQRARLEAGEWYLDDADADDDDVRHQVLSELLGEIGTGRVVAAGTPARAIRDVG